jgi:hypothetical protein
VSEQSVPTHADTKTSTHPVKNDRGNDRGPTPEKESRDGSSMRNNQKNRTAPIYVASFRQCGFSVFFKYHPNFLEEPIRVSLVELSVQSLRSASI